MRNRILALFLALCLGVSLIPCVRAAPAEGLCLGSTSEANISPSGSGTILLPSPVCSVRSVVAGASVTLECLVMGGDGARSFQVSIYREAVLIASETLALELPESGGVCIPSVTIDTELLAMTQGTYTVVFSILDSEGTVTAMARQELRVVTAATLPTGLCICDANDPGHTPVVRIHLEKGFSGLTSWYLCLLPEGVSGDWEVWFESSDTAVLEVESWAGYLAVNAKACGSVTLTGHAGDHTVTVQVEVCRDVEGHAMVETVLRQPTCTREGSKEIRCSKCGWVSCTVRIPASEHIWDAGVIVTPETPEHSAEIRYTCIICGVTEVRSCHVCPGKLFVDMPGEENWAHRGIDFCLWEGLMVGVDAAHFCPGAPITRGQLVTILWRMAGCPEPEDEAPFTDLNLRYYRKAIAWAAGEGIAKGVTDTHFCPNDPVTREQLAAFICRFARFQGRDVTARASLSAFPDGNSVSSFAQASMSWAVSTGLISGVGDGNGASFLQPKSRATRAQAAAILMRYCTEP